MSTLIASVSQLGRDCPWTEEQTPGSVLAFLRGEVDEVEAELDGCWLPGKADLISELGDVLFNALLAVEVCARDSGRGADGEPAITLDAVADSMVRKLRRRYPQLFDGSLRSMSVAQARQAWIDGKQAEKDAEAMAAEAAIRELDRLSMSSALAIGAHTQMDQAVP